MSRVLACSKREGRAPAFAQTVSRAVRSASPKSIPSTRIAMSRTLIPMESERFAAFSTRAMARLPFQHAIDRIKHAQGLQALAPQAWTPARSLPTRLVVALVSQNTDSVRLTEMSADPMMTHG